MSLNQGYTTKIQFLEAFDADPILYAEIDSSRTFPSVDYTVAITSLVLEDLAGNLTAAWSDALGFGDLVEVVSEDLQPNAAAITLDAFTFTSSLLGQWVRIKLGSSILRTDQHITLYVGQILGENRSRREYALSIQEGVYLQLLKTWRPEYQIKDQAAFVASAPADAQDKYVPIVWGDLAQIAGSSGRITAIPITNNAGPAANDFLVCRTLFGADAFTVSGVYQNGTSIGVVAAEVNGATYGYIKVTVAASDPTDVITVDISRMDPTNPITELQTFLTRSGIAVALLDTASFTAAEAVASARNYRLGGKITESTQMLGIVTDWLRSFSARGVFSGGQMGVVIRDYVLDYDAPDFTEAADMYQDSVSVNAAVDRIINRITYEAGFDAENMARIQGIESDAGSITTWDRRERSISLPWSANVATARDVAQRMIFDFREPRNIITFRTRLRASFDNLDILDNIRFTAENLYRRFVEITRRVLSGSDFSVTIEALDIDDLVGDAFRLGAEESKAADAPHDLPANDPRNCSVTGSIDDGGTLTTGAGTDTLTRAGGVSFVTRGVQVGDFVTLFQLAASGTPVNIGVYEIYEGGLSIGDPITTAGGLTVEDPNTGAAVAFTGAEVITYWWIARSWATADTEQRRQGYTTKADGTMSDGSAGKVLV